MKTTARSRRTTRVQKGQAKMPRSRRKAAEKDERPSAAGNAASSDQSIIEVVAPPTELDRPFRRITRSAARAARQATSSEAIKEEPPRLDRGKGKAKESVESKPEVIGTKRKRRGQDVVHDGPQDGEDVAQSRSTRRTRRRVETTTEVETPATASEALVPPPSPAIQAGFEASVEETTRMVAESTIQDVPPPAASSSRVTLEQTEHQPTLRSQDASNMDTGTAHTAGPAPPQEPSQLASSLNSAETQVGARPADEAPPLGINRNVRQRPIRPLPVRAPLEQAALERARRILRRFDLLRKPPSLLVNFDFIW